MNSHHARAVRISVVTLILDLGLGLAYGYTQGIGPYHGVYCAIGITTTVGCDISPTGDTGHWLVLGMICCVPLAGAILSLFTAGILADHIDKGHAQLKKDLQGGGGSEHEGRQPEPEAVGRAPDVPGDDQAGHTLLQQGG